MNAICEFVNGFSYDFVLTCHILVYCLMEQDLMKHNMSIKYFSLKLCQVGVPMHAKLEVKNVRLLFMCHT